MHSFAVGLNKGFVVTRTENVVRPANRKNRTSKRVREVRRIVRSVVDLTPLEKRVVEMLKTGVA